MTIQRSSALVHWNYFLALEEDLHQLARFVDLSGPNDSTFSIEIARLFLSACAEVDVVVKQVVKKHVSNSTADSINAYFPEVSQHCQNFVGYELIIPRYGLTLNPWIDWTANDPPMWWKDHNKVKHHRHNYFEKATLKNCLNAIGALFISVIHLYENEAASGELQNLPCLFNVADVHFGGVTMGRYGHSFSYRV